MKIDLIISVFCDNRRMSSSDILNTTRTNNICITRYMIWHYLHHNKGLSANKISKLFKRNIPSVFRGIRIIKHRFKYHKELCAEYQDIVSKLEGIAETTPSEDMMEEKN